MCINKKHEQKITLVIMVLIMTFVVTFVGTAKNLGFQNHFIIQWFKAWGFAFIVALPTVMLIMPVIKKTASRIICDDKKATKN